MASRTNLLRGAGPLAVALCLASAACGTAPGGIVGSLLGPEGPGGPEAPALPSNPGGDGLCFLPLPPEGCQDTPVLPLPAD